MHYVISATWGASDTTRASLPFIFAATALEKGDSIMIMLFHDAVTVAVEGAHEKMIPFGPPPKFKEVFDNPNAEVIVCKPCAEVRGISEDQLVKTSRMGGMGDFYAAVAREDSKAVSF